MANRITKAVAAIVITFWLLAMPADAAKRSPYDLVGNWTGAMEFGKFKFRMIIKVAKTAEGKLQVTMDNPEQGMRGMPITALLYNHPDVRIEIDQFRTAFNGTLNDALDQIDGEFEEGPGGRPIHVVFKRSTEASKPEPPKSYAAGPGEAPDLRGYWKSMIEPMPGMQIRLGLRVGRLEDGTFAAALDIIDQGAKDLPASSVVFSKPSATLEWQFMQTTFEAKLSSDGKTLAGDWKQMGRDQKLSFERIDKPLSALPEGVSFTPSKNAPGDIRGYWKGQLEVPGGMKLRLGFKIGQLPAGTYAGTMASIDQGNREIPLTSVAFTNSLLKIEARGIGGKFNGTLDKDGHVFDGKWEQMGNQIPLKLERGTASEAGAN